MYSLGMIVYFTIFCKNATMARAVEFMVRVLPLDNTAHVRAGSRHRNNLPLLRVAIVTIIANNIANDSICSETYRTLAEKCKRCHKMPGCRYTVSHYISCGWCLTQRLRRACLPKRMIDPSTNC